jgi:hypothetical protein
MKTILNNNQAFAIFKQNGTSSKTSFLRLHIYNKSKDALSYCNTYKIVYSEMEPENIYDIVLKDEVVNIYATINGKAIVHTLSLTQSETKQNESATSNNHLPKNKWLHFFSNPYRFIVMQFIPIPKLPQLMKG